MAKRTKKTKTITEVENVQSEDLVLTSEQEQALIENLKAFDLDTNEIKILFKYSSTTYNLLTFTLAEGCKVWWHSNNYLGWFPTNTANVLSKNLYRSFESSSTGTIVTPTSITLSSNGYFSYSYTRPTARNVENIIYCNVDIYDADKSTILRKKDIPLHIPEGEVYLSNITQIEGVYLNENTDASRCFSFEQHLGANTTVAHTRYEWLDKIPPFKETGICRVALEVETNTGYVCREELIVPVLESRDIDYPINLTPPPLDGHKEAIVYTSTKGGTYCTTYDFLSNTTQDLYISLTRIYTRTGISPNSARYLLNPSTKEWDLVTPSTTSYFGNCTTNIMACEDYDSILYSSVDIDDGKGTLYRAKNEKIFTRRAFNIETDWVKYENPTTNPKDYDNTIAGYFIYKPSLTGSNIYAYCFRGVNGNKIYNAQIAPYNYVKVGTNTEMMVLSWNNSTSVWAVSKAWGKTNSVQIASSLYSTFYESVCVIDNVNIYLTSSNMDKEALLYQYELPEGAVYVDKVTLSKTIYVGDIRPSFNVEYRLGKNTSLDFIEYSWINETPPFVSVGNYGVDVTVWTDKGTSDTVRHYFSVYDENLPYPTDLPIPVEDGHQKIIVFVNNNEQYELVTFDLVQADAYFSLSTTSLGMGYLKSATERIKQTNTGYCRYIYSELTGEWILSSTRYPSSSFILSNVPRERVVYTNIDIYTDTTYTELLYKASPLLPREPFDVKTMQRVDEQELTDPRLADSTIQSYMIVYGSYSSLNRIYCLALKDDYQRVPTLYYKANTSSNSSSDTFEVRDTTQLKVLQWNNGTWTTYSGYDWSNKRTAFNLMIYDNRTLFGSTYELFNINLRLSDSQFQDSYLLYETEITIEPAPIFFAIDGDVRQGVLNELSDVKAFDGEKWFGIETTQTDTGVAMFDGEKWVNLSLY